MRKARIVQFHDDPPCNARLDEGFCNNCNLLPDMQSIMIYFYCPKCDVLLKNMQCAECGEKFKRYNWSPDEETTPGHEVISRKFCTKDNPFPGGELVPDEVWEHVDVEEADPDCDGDLVPYKCRNCGKRILVDFS